MNGDISSALAIIAVLIALQFLIAAVYAALKNIRVGYFRELAEDRDPKAIRVLALNASTSLGATYYFLSTLLYFGIAAASVLGVSEGLISENSTGNVAIYAVVLVLTACITVVLGDIVPEAVGSTYADKLAPSAAGMVQVIITVLSPVMFVLTTISRLISALMGSEGLVNTVTEEEIMTLVEEGHTGGTIEDEEKNMIYSILQLDQTKVSEVMIPRIDIIAVEINDTMEAAMEQFIQSGFSRIPVFDRNIDDIKGLLYAKDLMAYYRREIQPKTIAELMRPVHFVSEATPAHKLLKEIQIQRVHMAIVVDEYGGTAGLVTIENIIEEIIGDIQDEYDVNEEAEYIQNGPDEYIVDGAIDLDDFNELLDVDLPSEDIDTLGGFIYTYFERIPITGDRIDTDELSLEIIAVEGHRIRKVLALRKRQTDAQDTGESDDDSSNEQQQIQEAG